MKLHEYQARQLLEAYGIPVPAGRVTADPQEAGRIAAELGGRVVVKAQVLVGGRGKAGGIQLAATPEEAQAAAGRILSMAIKDIPVRRVLVGRAVDIQEEYYLAVTVNRAEKGIECISSASGGVDIEEVAAREPQKIVHFLFEPLEAPDEARLEERLSRVFPDALAGAARDIAVKMYRLLRDKDGSLVEVNPLARTPPGASSPPGVPSPEGDLVAADAKIVIDDNGLEKHPDIERLRNLEEYSQDELDARAASLSFVSLDGTIGCIVNGAGLAMATMDLVKLLGGSPANFLDVGGSSSPQKVLNALAILLRNPRLRGVLINIFGGITRCDDIARGILLAREQVDIRVPMVIRLIGTNEEEGRRILKEAGLTAAEDLTEAVRTVIAAAGRRP
jgi:succinyl-CoA synthetase beta subunit